MRRENETYLFTVEGETEGWYFRWLQDAIHSSAALRTAKLDCNKKDPVKMSKSLSVLEKTEVIHVIDRESEDTIHVQRFQFALNRMKEAQKNGKVKYRLGYSNFAFELWMILHKADCNGPLHHRSDYLPLLNSAYSEQFESLDKYKKEDNFKRILSKLTLDDVGQAIRRSKGIMRRNEENGCTLHEYKGHKYYKENPALSIGEVIEKILVECGLSQYKT